MCKCMHAMKPTDAEKQEAKNHARECADGKFQVPDPPEDREHQQHQQHQQREHDADPNAPVDLQSCQRRLRFLYRQQRQEIRKIQKQLNDDEEAQVLQDYGSCIVRKLKLVTDDGRQIRREFFTEEIDKKFGAYPDIKRGLLEKLNGECSQYTKGEDWEKMVNCLWQYCAAA
ncbi:unnamed protein product [Darwinula stevensoni]|uniref:Uncharacterized protein n=1 Tax=Darwinula stevensoni TaxID=69355 RepID=A0A7R9AI88_9CRUS|nr:unnamed protein product [Darwinula stevensoni]CAG0906149.1 unnamed protein product [Darwinula stevensoni]